MMKRLFRTVVLTKKTLFYMALACLGLTVSAQAAPIYIGVQDGNGAITTVVSNGNGNGTFGSSSSPIEVGTSGIYVSGSDEGTPPLPEPEIISNAVDVSGEHDGNGGTISIYMSELNQFPLASSFNSFFSKFAATIPSTWDGFTTNSVISVTESTYVSPCAVPNSACTASDAFKTADLLSTVTFTAQGTDTAGGIAQIPAGLTTPYSTTEVYTVTFGAGYGDVSSLIDVSVPEPASLALLSAGLFGLGYVRKRSA
jgi:hypothetical protein